MTWESCQVATCQKSGRITLRVEPKLHQQIADLAEALGLDINAVLNLMIRRSYGQLALEAHLFQQHAVSGEFIPVFLAWRAAYPSRRPREFLAEFLKYVMGEPSSIDGVGFPPHRAHDKASVDSVEM